MNDSLRSIVPGQGLGDLKLGLQRKQVQDLLKEPTEVEMFSYPEDAGEGNTEVWHYDLFELSLAFDEEDDWRLGSIALTSDFYELDSKQMVGLRKLEVIQMLEGHQVTDVAFEDVSADEGPANELLSVDSLGLYFWFDDDVLTELQMSPLIADDDRIDWPA